VEDVFTSVGLGFLVAAEPKVETLRLRDIEREFDPEGGWLGRGVLMSKAAALSLDTAGYKPYTVPGSSTIDFPIYGADGSPTTRMWRGFVRHEGDKHIVAAVEYDNV
jgi:hypothetical protein